MRRRTALLTVPVLAAGVIASGAGTADAAPSQHANCVAQITTNPDYGPPGPPHFGALTGPLVSYVATHSEGGGSSAFCESVLLDAFTHVFGSPPPTA